MLRFVYGSNTSGVPSVLIDTMFRDRACQFRDRLGWPVDVNGNGHERDEYDDLNPVYVIWQNPNGCHGGSMRFLPTMGRTMVNEHFLNLTNGVAFNDPLIWECTRFCLGPHAERIVAPSLMLGGAEIMRKFGLNHFVGVFDRRLERVYRLAGAAPKILGKDNGIAVGLWTYAEGTRKVLLARAGLTSHQVESWFGFPGGNA